jgi:nucleoside-diphosphate-sugar epimerase
VEIKKVLITGATGFVGSRLCECLLLTRCMEARVFIHSTSSAARIARFPLDFVIGDLCDRNAVFKAIEGCDAVVHLARGNNRSMKKGLKNLLAAASASHVSRFVHMSSVAVYGNNPPPGSVSESEPAHKTDMAYGNAKLEEEKLVFSISKRSALPVVVLRPPNIYGPYSGFTVGLIERIRSGKMALVDGGTNPCNLVYIDNLIQAILLSLCKEEAVGNVFFVTDAQCISWRTCVADYASLLKIPISGIPSLAPVQHSRQRIFRDSVRALPRVFLSGEFRSVMRQVPLIGVIESRLYERFQSLSLERQEELRHRVNGGSSGSRSQSSSMINPGDPVIVAQTRAVVHSSQKAAKLLGYNAPVTYREGMRLTECWLRASGMI